MQCSYNVTLRRVPVTIVAVGKQRITYSVSTALVLCGMQSACAVLQFSVTHWLCHSFLLYLINGTIIEKKGYWRRNACFDFVYYFCQKYISF